MNDEFAHQRTTSLPSAQVSTACGASGVGSACGAGSSSGTGCSSTVAPAPAVPLSAATPAPPAVPPTAIIVSRRQQGNPVLRSIRNVPWAYGETSADYMLSESTCALYLSVRYHLLHPRYLERRLLELSAGYTLRLVLVLVDSEDSEAAVQEVTLTAMAHDASALLAWSVAEAARYLETLRAYAKKPADLIKERSDGSFLSQLVDCLTTVRPLNKTDVATLHHTFGSLASILSVRTRTARASA